MTLRMFSEGMHICITDGNLDEGVDEEEDLFLCGIFLEADLKTFGLLSLRVPPRRRGSGLGSAMLRMLIEECKRVGTERIEVDDMSERARQDSHNIYVKHGFEYRHDIGPEMVLRIL